MRWKGELAKPIVVKVVRPHGFVVPNPSRDSSANEKIEAENQLLFSARDKLRRDAENRKLELLADHYGIASSDFQGLALALARCFVPGFQFKDNLRPLSAYGAQPDAKLKPGRPAAWGATRLEQLFKEVRNYKATHRVTDRSALAALARKGWPPPPNHRGTRDQWLETLESRLQEAKNRRRVAARALASTKKLLRESQRQIPKSPA
jgi:hypothetical protein